VVKTALGTRQGSYSIESRFRSILGAVFRLIWFVKSKSKSNYEFASLIRLYARFARSSFKCQL